MNKKLSLRAGTFIVFAAASLAISSCAYDPYYSSVSGSYASGYGSGYGYGSSNFSTSLFVSTGDPRWGYDPYCYSYYDYTRRCYYDPYLNGYYPVGYRPPVVVGVPHPYGWRPGRGYCPPRNVRTVTVSNYRNREAAYRSTDYAWAKKARVQPISQNRSYGGPNRAPARGESRSYSGESNYPPSGYGTRSDPRQPSREYSAPSRTRSTQPQRVGPSSRQPGPSGLPSGYNTPVTRTPSRQFDPGERTAGQRGSMQRSQPAQPSQPSFRPDRSRGNQDYSPETPRGGGGGERQPRSREDIKRSIKGLGQG